MALESVAQVQHPRASDHSIIGHFGFDLIDQHWFHRCLASYHIIRSPSHVVIVLSYHRHVRQLSTSKHGIAKAEMVARPMGDGKLKKYRP